MKSRLDVDVLGGQKGLRLGPVVLDDHQPQAAIVPDIPGPGDQLKTHPVPLQDGFGVHGLVGRVEQQDEMPVGQVRSGAGGWVTHFAVQ